MRPCDCRDQVEANALNEQGIGINDWNLTVDPTVVKIRHHYGTLRIPMTIFKRFAEWYLEDQDDIVDKAKIVADMNYHNLCARATLFPGVDIKDIPKLTIEDVFGKEDQSEE